MADNNTVIIGGQGIENIVLVKHKQEELKFKYRIDEKLTKVKLYKGRVKRYKKFEFTENVDTSNSNILITYADTPESLQAKVILRNQQRLADVIKILKNDSPTAFLSEWQLVII